MSQENVEIARRGFEHFKATGELLAETLHPDFVWDMSKFRGWPERQAYPGIEGAMQFIADWTGSWEAWELELRPGLDVPRRKADPDVAGRPRLPRA